MVEAIWQLDAVWVDGPIGPRLRDISASIAPGVTAVIGPSGAGKTTLLNLLVGFEHPSRGSVRFLAAGRSSNAPGAGDLFWVPPDDGLWPQLTVRQHLEAAQPAHDAAAKAAVDALLAEFDLADHAATKPAYLSAGLCDRLSVARAIASGARALVMDEPLVHVDASRAAMYWSIVRRHVAERGVSLVFATHDTAAVLAEADRVLCIDGGELLYHGDARSLYDNPPSERLAAMLGVCNWFTPDDAAAWLGDGHAPGGYRPHRIAVEPRDAGGCVVRSTRRGGVAAVTDVEHTSTGESRRIWHRANGAALAPGQRVALRIVSQLLAAIVLFAAAGLGGCGDAGDDRPLAVKSVHHHLTPPQGAFVPAPRGVGIGLHGEVLVLDTAGRVIVYDSAGVELRRWFMPSYDVGKPEGICQLDDGRIAVADTHYHRVVLFDPDGRVDSMFGSHGHEPGQFAFPVAVTTDRAGHLYVAEYGENNDRVQKLTLDGRPVAVIGSFGSGPGRFQRPSGVVWHDGRVYVADAFNNRIQVFTDEGDYIGVLGGDLEPLTLHYPYDLSMGPDGLMAAPEYGGGRVSVFDTAGRLVGRFGTPGGGAGQLATPWGLAIDPTGRIWVADTGNRRLVEVVR